MNQQKKSKLNIIAGAMFLVLALLYTICTLLVKNAASFFGMGMIDFYYKVYISIICFVVIGAGMFIADRFPVPAIGFAGLFVFHLSYTMIITHGITAMTVLRVLYLIAYAGASVMSLSRLIKIDKVCRKIWFVPGIVYIIGFVIWFVLQIPIRNINLLFYSSSLMLYLLASIIRAVFLGGGMMLAMKYITDGAAQPAAKANPYGYNQYGQNPYGGYNQPNNGYNAYNQPNNGYAYNQPNNGYNAYNQPNNGFNGYNNSPYGANQYGAPMNAYNAPIEEEEATQIEGYDAPRAFDREAEIRKYRAMLQAGQISSEEYNARIVQLNRYLK